MKKICRVCGKSRPLDDFNRSSCGRDGHRTECWECQAQSSKDWRDKNNYSYPTANKNRNLIAMYGIDLDFYNDLYSKQNGRCLICGKSGKNITVGTKKDSLFVDHDHRLEKGPGSVRGLVCINCNFAIGHCKDDYRIAVKIAKMLLNWDKNKRK